MDGFSRSWLALSLLVGPMVLSIVSFVYSLYLSRCHLDTMMHALKTSRFLFIWGPVWRRQGWIGGVVLITKVAGIVVMPKIHIRHGEVDAIEITNFPNNLRRLLIVYVVMVAISLIWAAIMFLWLKFQ